MKMLILPRIYTAVLLLLLTTSLCLADGTAYIDLSKLEKDKQFRFLVGNWTYRSEDNTAHGKSTGLLQVNASVVSETTHGSFGDTDFIGQALYLFDAENQQWHQRWIDSLGNVLESKVRLAAYEDSEFPAMIGEFEFDGQKFKHVWFDISESGYQTDLLSSTDDGQTFKLVRRMPYQNAGN